MPVKIPTLIAALFLMMLSGAVTSTQEAAGQRNPAFYSYPYHHLEWYTIESDHFLVHFQEGNSRPAQVISRIAEEIYVPITELYQHEPDHKVNILLIDRLDYSNGAAFFYDNKIEIWLPSLDMPLRGTHNWLRNVITHEFTHIIQLQASMRQSRRRPAAYIQWLSYEDVRRPDVLYGFPNGIISYPLSGISMPGWLAEGTAQYMREEIFYDYWDTHRDMVLRTRMLDSTWLSLEKMGTFSSKTSLERELVYNQGFAFTRYLADRFGEQSLADISKAFSNRRVYDVRKAIKQATGHDGRDVFNDWVEELTAEYQRFAEGRNTNPSNRKWVESAGFFNFHPKFHPDGQQIAYLSNKMTDGSMAGLFFRDLDQIKKTSEKADTRVGDSGSGALELHLFGSTEHDISTQTAGSSSNHTAKLSEQAPSTQTAGSSSNHAPFTRSTRHHGHATPSSRTRFHTLNHHAVTHGNHHQCQIDAAALQRLETSFSYSPDGSRIAYSRNRTNAYGELYRDIHIYYVNTKQTKRLTFSERLQDPAWSPDGHNIAAGKIEDGSINLYLYDLENDSLTKITDFHKGEQLYSPAWHPEGNHLYAAYSDTAHRGIYKIALTGEMTPVLASAHVDYRDPMVSHDGRWLYYSADHQGVYNIYRMSLADGSIHQLTNVIGGAFMPYPHPEKELLLYSEYVSDGYKIALLDVSADPNLPAGSGLPADPNLSAGSGPPADPRLSFDPNPAAERFHLGFGQNTAPDNPGQTPAMTVRLGNAPVHPVNHFDDSDIEPFSREALAVADTGVYRYRLPTRGSSPDRQFYSYNDQFTSFQFYPVLRFDNYTRLRGSNTTLLTNGRFGDLGSNLWRDLKVGTYFTSREMRERFSIFGGVLFGPGSRSSDGVSDFFRPGRLVNLDRDIFFEAEYAGIPFIKRHWSPTISFSFFNIRRNVQDGLQIEEFPCTSCLPDTTSTNISYNMWQMEVNLISKLNRWSLLELGYYYSPYRVSTDAFFSREFRQEISGSTSRYYIGSTWTTAYIFNLSFPDRHGDIAPVGWRGMIRYRFEPSELLDSYDIRDGSLIPVYNKYNNHSVEADVRLGFNLMQQRFNLRTRFFTYMDGPDEFFYLDYIGGMTGMRSYPFFALGGTTTAFTQLSWFIPLKTDIYRQMGRVTLDKVYLRLFTEAGNGWGGPLDIDNSIKTGVGAELRVGMNSYYFFPTSFFISSAYGFDSYDLQLPDAFITDTATGRVRYGNQILINFGILFDFEF